MSASPLVSINLCTYFRPDGLRRCLETLLRQDFEHPYEIVVIDNDRDGSARTVVDEFAPIANVRQVPLRYFIEPVQNIALARNRAIAESRGEYIALIDDDEWAADDWLTELLAAVKAHAADGVHAPVLPHFNEDFPKPMRRMPYFQIMDREAVRVGRLDQGFGSGNVLLKKAVLSRREGPFEERLGRTGNSDIELFRFLISTGCVFYQAPRAAVWEEQSRMRAGLRWHVRRSYRSGYGIGFMLRRTEGFLRAALKTPLLAIRCVLGTGKDMVRYARLPSLWGMVLLVRFAYFLGLLGALADWKVVEYEDRSPDRETIGRDDETRDDGVRSTAA